MPEDEPLLPRVQELVADLTRRLTPVCAHMPVSEFTALVRRMAEIEYKYEQLGSGSRELR